MNAEHTKRNQKQPDRTPKSDQNLGHQGNLGVGQHDDVGIDRKFVAFTDRIGRLFLEIGMQR